MPRHLRQFFILPALISLVHFTLNAQDTIVFREGLASGRAHQYGREAVYTDTLLPIIHAVGAVKPAAGQVWFEQDGVVKRWTAVKADPSGGFRDRAISNGYLYLTFQSDKAMPAILSVTGNGAVYVNGEPRPGDPYSMGWLHLPVNLRKGINEFYIRAGGIGWGAGMKAMLIKGIKPVALSTQDATVPHLVRGQSSGSLVVGLQCLNASGVPRKGLRAMVSFEGRDYMTDLPAIPAWTVRKVPIHIPVPAQISQAPEAVALIRLMEKGKIVDSVRLSLAQVDATASQSHTFLSGIDGSVQYYAVTPQLGGPKPSPALYFSVHGAGVEAIGQARAYRSKPDGPLVAPTNRRPRGFNWEDWGRLDALEVLNIVQKQYAPDPSRLYLTGHSMGGHGTWFLGATYAGTWAAIAPCAGYPVLQSYGSADGKIPTEGRSPLHAMLLRASNPSNVLELARNYAAGGVYIYHGDDDRTVSVDYARQMRKVLADFHPDFGYYEYPGGSHWFGDISVDWPPLFSFLNIHRTLPSVRQHRIDFTTASPSISARHHWVGVPQQQHSLAYSRVKLQRDTVKRTIIGTTENCAVLTIRPDAFRTGDELTLDIDKSRLTMAVSDPSKDIILARKDGSWVIGALPAVEEKGVSRGGGLKDAFRHRMIFVYGTKGTPEENRWAEQKARFDAESWYYRGNGAVDIIADNEYLDSAYKGRGLVLYGNATTNDLYKRFMKASPVRMERGRVYVGARVFEGDDLSGAYVWPNPEDPFTSVALIGGTGIKGMRAADANQYFAGGSGFPDFIIHGADISRKGAESLMATGFYDQRWQLGTDHIIK
ncbi:MAG: alpha/beta hydrolase [Chitinophagaceae bacterium]